MGILYMKEHTTCYNYTRYMREGFLCYKFREGERGEEVSETNFILFMIEGSLEFSCNGENLKVSAGNMICVSRGNLCKIYSPGNGSAVIALFDNMLQSCEKVAISKLYSQNIQTPDGVNLLHIKSNLQLFLDLLIRYLEDGANCFHFHELKLKELFWLIRFYYTRAEQAAFLNSILGNDYEFKRLVLENYRKVRTVKELAGLCGSSLSSFKRKFLKEFREPASDWLQKQMNGMIKYKLADENIPLGDIAEELNFSSLPQFCRYCKRNFGCTPGEWRKLLKGKEEISEDTWYMI